MRTRICDLFDIELPIFAFSHCRDVVAAVSRAGGMGVLGALAFSPAQLEVELKWIDEHADGKPYGVDIVMPVSSAAAGLGITDHGEMKLALQEMIPQRHRQFVDELLERYRVPAAPEGGIINGLLGWTGPDARSHVDVALAHPTKLLVNALGPPPQDVVEKARGRGVLVAALVGSVRQARKQVEAGVDVIVAQGTEAGGHTGEVSTFVLVPDVVDAVRPTPVLAAGGIGTGRQIAAALALGADGVWTGSVWLTVTESDTVPVLKQKLFDATSRDTVRSRSWTGKPARLLRTAWTDAWEAPDSPGTLQMPLQFLLSADALSRMYMYAHLEKSGAKDLLSTPVGQIVGRLQSERPVREVIYEMMEEFLDAVERVSVTVEAAEKGGGPDLGPQHP